MSSPIQVKYDDVIIDPGPMVTVNKEFIYANDSIIGYTYTINLKGYASSINKKFETTNSNLVNTIQSLDDIQNTLHRNGKTLKLYCPDSGTNQLVAHGGILRSFDVEETDNRWTQYARYSAQIEFNSVFFKDQGIAIAFDSQTGSSSTYSLYQGIKSYNDNWSFNTSPETINKSYLVRNYKEDYTQIEVEYTISATGKHFFDTNGNETTRPAYINAKEFVQKKLREQIQTFYDSSPLGYISFSGNSYDSTQSNNLPRLTQSHSVYPIISSHYPILGENIRDNYRIFNETINCSSSESDGSFSATYSCIIRYFPFLNDGIITDKTMMHANHSFDLAFNKVRNFDSNNMTITVNGTITGMLQTNIIAAGLDGNPMLLPPNGPLIFMSPDQMTKYYNALYCFNNYIADATHTDLKDEIKTRFDINHLTLFPGTSQFSPCGGEDLQLKLGEPKTFNVTHNYKDGTINYSAEYDTDRNCAIERGFETLTITEEDPVPIIAEFIVPGRSGGPIIQSLNSYTSKKVSLEFSGTSRKGCDTGTPWAPNFSGTTVCNTDYYVHIPEKVLSLIENTEEYAAILSKTCLLPTSYNTNYNPVDGTYSLNKSYIVCPYNEVAGNECPP
jgi:hypothetical protein